MGQERSPVMRKTASWNLSTGFFISYLAIFTHFVTAPKPKGYGFKFQRSNISQDDKKDKRIRPAV
jgi:hypothetical protein